MLNQTAQSIQSSHSAENLLGHSSIVFGYVESDNEEQNPGKKGWIATQKI
jgi:hypothetical protein